MKANEVHYFSDLFDTYFGLVYWPSSGVSQHCIQAIGICHSSSVGVCLQTPTELAWQIPITCMRCWETPDDGQ